MWLLFALFALLAAATGSANVVLADYTGNPPYGAAGALFSEQNQSTPVPKWTVVDIPHFGEESSELKGVEAISADDVWAVGNYFGAGRPWSLTLHWDGTQWTRFPCPGYGLSAVSGIEKDDVWAISLNGTYHWDGTSWSEVSIPAINDGALGELYSIDAISANDAWAVGYYQKSDVGDLPLTMHWNGTQWALIPGPDVVPGPYDRLYSVAAVSPADVWAVGSYQAQTLTLHWDGNRWKVIPSPDAPVRNLDYLTGLAANSRNDIWAVGGSEQRGDQGFAAWMLAMHWNGVRWALVSTPDIEPWAGLAGIAALSRNDIWAVGDQGGPGNNGETLTVHWSGTRWSVIPSPNRGKGLNHLSGVVSLPSGDVWAVGSGTNDTSPAKALDSLSLHNPGGGVGLLLLHMSSTTGTSPGMPHTGGNTLMKEIRIVGLAIALSTLLVLTGYCLRNLAFGKLDKEKEHA